MKRWWFCTTAGSSLSAQCSHVIEREDPEHKKAHRGAQQIIEEQRLIVEHKDFFSQ